MRVRSRSTAAVRGHGGLAAAAVKPRTVARRRHACLRSPNNAGRGEAWRGRSASQACGKAGRRAVQRCGRRGTSQCTGAARRRAPLLTACRVAPQVILKRDVQGIGKQGDIAKVLNGYWCVLVLRGHLPSTRA